MTEHRAEAARRPLVVLHFGANRNGHPKRLGNTTCPTDFPDKSVSDLNRIGVQLRQEMHANLAKSTYEYVRVNTKFGKFRAITL